MSEQEIKEVLQGFIDDMNNLHPFQSASIKMMSLMQNEPNYGFVYFLKNDDTGLTKIGFTKDLPARMKAITNQFKNLIGTEPNLRLIAVQFTHEKVMKLVEKEFHSNYKNSRKFGEWFDISEEGIVNEVLGENQSAVIDDVAVDVSISNEYHLYNNVQFGNWLLDKPLPFLGKILKQDIASKFLSGIEKTGIGIKSIDHTTGREFSIGMGADELMTVGEYKSHVFIDGGYVEVIKEAIEVLS